MNKTIYATILIITAFNLNSQELDESFLESLPKDIKKDVLDRAAGKGENIEENFSSFQYSSKLEQAEKLSELKTRIEKDLKELERRLSSDEEISIDDELMLFGSSFFNTFQTSFMPTNEPNLDSSYTLDVGDILNIQVIGQMDYDENFSINGDGTINLPDIGKISLAGLSISEASKIIKLEVSTTFIGTEAFISLDKIRDVNVLVTGNTKNPGIYTLTGNSNVLHALSAAGGVNEFGSYREINLIRNDEIVDTLDVYDLLIDGKYNLKKRSLRYYIIKFKYYDKSSRKSIKICHQRLWRN